MRKVYEIKNENLIEDILEDVEYGTLAICSDNIPYSLPLNFVSINKEIFFHGAKKGKKIDIMKNNKCASFSVVESYSQLPSYFSTDTGNASPATHMFKSVIIDGTIEFVEDYKEKASALGFLMQKYQKEGGYKPLNDDMYKKIINATCLYKLIPEQRSAKFHLGQDYNEERFIRVCEHLKQRGTDKDLKTLELINQYRKK